MQSYPSMQSVKFHETEAVTADNKSIISPL